MCFMLYIEEESHNRRALLCIRILAIVTVGLRGLISARSIHS